MSLYLSGDWPACSPSPLSNEILIVGPSFDSVSQASQAPIATATSGTIQMNENRRERLVVACSIVRCSARLVMASLPIVCLPQQGAGNLKPSSKYWLKLGQQMVSEVHLPVSTRGHGARMERHGSERRVSRGRKLFITVASRRANWRCSGFKRRRIEFVSLSRSLADR